jgi:hypothetical protein
MKKMAIIPLTALTLSILPVHAEEWSDVDNQPSETCEPIRDINISALERQAANADEPPINMKIIIYLSTQHMELQSDEGEILLSYPVSTAKNGAGESHNSGRTPRGKHIVRAKIGEGCPENTVFVRRRLTGEVYSPQLAQQFPQRDWILSRILWLSGQVIGFNRLGKQDSMRRFIYIHGTPDSEPMGVPLSHGCIRMRNADIIELYSMIPNGTEVEIVE